MGIDRIDHILMILGISLDMRENEREAVTKAMISGFNECALEAGCFVTGG
jgi:selenide,water dikinase